MEIKPSTCYFGGGQSRHLIIIKVWLNFNTVESIVYAEDLYKNFPIDYKYQAIDMMFDQSLIELLYTNNWCFVKEIHRLIKKEHGNKCCCECCCGSNFTLGGIVLNDQIIAMLPFYFVNAFIWHLTSKIAPNMITSASSKLEISRSYDKAYSAACSADKDIVVNRSIHHFFGT